MGDGAGTIFRDSKFGLLVQTAVAAVVGIGTQLLTDLQAEAGIAIGLAAGLASGWLTAKKAKHLPAQSSR
jgi:hypothetical protein